MNVPAPMNSNTKRESLPAVTAAGVVAILFGVLGAIGSLLSVVSLMLLPDLEKSSRAAPMPPGVRAMSIAFMLFTAAICVFGIFVGVGVLRRRNWARIGILVWAGFMTFVCLSALAFSFVIFSVMQKQMPGMNAEDTARIMLFTKIFLAVFYAMPASVGVWWLILFTRKRVATAFTSPAESVMAMDSSGFPQPRASFVPAPQKPKPACPLPLSVFSVFLIFSSVCTLLYLLFPLPASFPLFLFGHTFSGGSFKIWLAVFGGLSIVAGFGMLKLKPWAFYMELAMMCLGLVNGLVTILSPGILPPMRLAMQRMMEQYPASPVSNLFFSDTYLRGSMIFGLVMCAAFIALLLFQRSRFLEAAAEAANA